MVDLMSVVVDSDNSPSTRPEHSYRDGAEGSSHGLTATDSSSVPSPLAPSVDSQAKGSITALGVGYRAVAAPTWRTAALWIATIAVDLALIFEIVASLFLSQRALSVPSQTDLQWGAWLYDYSVGTRWAAAYPPIALWIALVAALVLVGRLLVVPTKAVKKAGNREKSMGLGRALTPQSASAVAPRPKGDARREDARSRASPAQSPRGSPCWPPSASPRSPDTPADREEGVRQGVWDVERDGLLIGRCRPQGMPRRWNRRRLLRSRGVAVDDATARHHSP